MYWIHGITTLAIQDGLVRMLEPAVALKHKIGHKKVKVLAATQKISRKSESIENSDGLHLHLQPGKRGIPIEQQHKKKTKKAIQRENAKRIARK